MDWLFFALMFAIGYFTGRADSDDELELNETD
jgi:hypothetical protein